MFSHVLLVLDIMLSGKPLLYIRQACTYFSFGENNISFMEFPVLDYFGEHLYVFQL